MNTLDTDLKSQLVALELHLLKPEVRANESELDRLIADDFFEIAASGLRFGKREALSRIPHETAPKFQAFEFNLIALTNGAALLTYKSVLQKHNEETLRYSLRSSIWRENEQGWQMLFHQGTPCAPF